MVKPEEMVVLDRWAVGCAKAAQKGILAGRTKHPISTKWSRIMRFCSVEMGSFYLDIIKDRQYTAKADRWRIVAADCAVSHRRSAGALDGADPLLHR
ncbi:hypothetical protein ACLK19_00170 [Escherichia coli]